MPDFYLVGLAYFDGCTRQESRALLPNGLQSTANLPPHYASVVVALDDCLDYDWWPGLPLFRRVDTGGSFVDLLEFRIPIRAEVRFPSGKTTKQCIDFADGLAKLQDADPSFQPDFVNADSIAEVPIPGGTLAALTLDDAELVHWSVVDVSGDYTVEAQALSGSKPQGHVYSIKVRDGASVVLANTPDFVTPEVASRSALHAHHDHFELYGKIAKSRNGSAFVHAAPARSVGPVNTSSNGYLQFLKHSQAFTTAGGGGGCSATCCKN